MEESQCLDEATKRRLTAEYIGTVRRIAHGIARNLPREVSVDDLIGAGLVGLADALVKHRGHTEEEFASYVGCRIRGAIADELRRGDPLTRTRRRLERRKNAAVRELVARRGRSPRESEIAASMGIPLTTLRQHVVDTSFRDTTAFDPVTGAGLGGQQYPDDTVEMADARVARSEQRERLSATLATLPHRMQEILRLYYEQDYSLREIGEAMGVTESRVCQLHREAIQRLRAACADQDRNESDAGGQVVQASGWI